MTKTINFFIYISFTILFLVSCNKIETLDKIVFDNDVLSKININAELKEINSLYQISYADPFIDHTMSVSPLDRIKNWINSNVIIFGSLNRLTINIQDAAITQKIINNDKEYLYEMSMEINYLLYDDNDEILANTEVKVKRSTTSSKFISLRERENILDSLTLESLIDVSNKSTNLLKIHMKEYVY